MNFTNLELVLGTTLSLVGLYLAYRALALKVGRMKVRGGYTRISSIACQDEYVGRITLENVRDRAVTIFAIYLKFGHSLYLEIDDFGDSPIILGAFETFQKQYGPLEFYSAGTKRIRLDKLFADQKVKKRLVLSTSDGKYTVRRLIPMWDPVHEFFRNYMTGIARPVRSTYKGEAYGSNTIYLVELGIADGAPQVMPIYPRDDELKRFRRFQLTPESLKTKESLESFLNHQREEGKLPVASVKVRDLRASREERFESDFKETIEAESLGLIQYYLLGWILTRIDNFQMRRQNKARVKRASGTDQQVTKEPAPPGPKHPPPDTK